MRSSCDMIGQGLIIISKTIETKVCPLRDTVRSFCCHGGTGQFRKMVAYFVRAVQGGLVGKGLNNAFLNSETFKF